MTARHAPRPAALLATALLTAGLLAGPGLGAPAAQAAPRPASTATAAPVATKASPVRGTATTRATIRASAKAAGTVVGWFEAGQRIPTTAPATQGFVRVRFRGKVAYVAAGQLTTTAADAPPRPATIRTSGTKVATADLKMRSGPGRAQALVGTLAEGRTLKLTGRLDNGYAETTVAQKPAWVSVYYLATARTLKRSERALAFARAQLRKPYRYGAAGPEAYDCSGLTQASWRAAGITLPRTAAQQFGAGTKIKKADLRPGDLVFFYGSTPSHVAIYVGDGKIIQSPRPGRKVEYSQVRYMPYAGARRPG